MLSRDTLTHSLSLRLWSFCFNNFIVRAHALTLSRPLSLCDCGAFMFQQFSVRQRHDQRGFGGDVIAKRIIVRQLSIAPPRSPVLIRRNNTLPLGPLLRRQGIVTEKML